MNHNPNSKIADNQKPNKIHKEIRSVYEGQQLEKKENFEELENKMNAKVLKITSTIKEQYPELLEYLNEMPVTIPAEKNPEINLKTLKTYYESLISVLAKYKLEHF